MPRAPRDAPHHPARARDRERDEDGRARGGKARAAVHLIYGDVSARCPLCVHDPASRIAWGCDAPAEPDEPVFWRTCGTCNGWDPACPTCEGRGKEMVKRCPASQVDAGTRALMAVYRQYDERGVLPCPGGWTDQPASFAAFVAVVDGERGAIAAERERLREAARKRKGKR